MPQPQILNTLPATQADVPGATEAELRLDLSQQARVLPQVEAYFRGLGDPRKYGGVVLPMQAHAAVAFAAMAAHARGSLSLEFALIPFRQTVPAGWLGLSAVRHDDVRTKRFQALSRDQAMAPGFTVLDCSPRGFTSEQFGQLAAHLRIVDDQLLRVVKCDPGQVKIEDLAGAEGERLQGLVFAALQEAGVCLSNLQVAQQRILVNPAPLGVVAAYLALVLQGALEVWPLHIRLASAGNNVFQVAELVDVNAAQRFVDTWVRDQDASTPRVVVTGPCPAAFLEALTALAAAHGVEVRQ